MYTKTAKSMQPPLSRHLSSFLVFAVSFLLLSGCSSDRDNGGNGLKIIHHPKPELKVDFSPFENTGCPLDQYGHIRVCRTDSKLYALGCDRLRNVADQMGGLSPAYPMAACHYMPYYRTDVVDKFSTPKDEYFFNVGGPMPELVRYLIFKDGNVQLIKNAEEFRAVFAPVESADEALGFALALDRIYAQYDQKVDPKYVYNIETLEDTFVKKDGDGYIVHAFDYRVFGCGPHYYYAVDVAVTRDGKVQETSRTQIYRDPKFDGLCVD